MQSVRLRADVGRRSKLSSLAGLPGPVVHLLPDTHAAGAEKQCLYLLSELVSSDARVELAYFGAGRAHSSFASQGAPMLHVPRSGRFRWDAYGRARRLRRAYAGRHPAILHTWMLEGNIVGLLAARAWPDTRVVITQRGSWNELDYPAMVRLQRLLLGRADHAISNSTGGAEMLAQLGLPPSRISVIANGLPEDRLPPGGSRDDVRARHGWGDSEVVLWVGRVSDAATARQKDVENLFRAFAELRRSRPGARLALVGTTAEELAAQGLGPPEGAEPLGWHPAPAELYAGADVLAISSRREGNSNVAAEALIAGLPVVSTDCGDHCGPVADSGVVVPVEDPSALARGLGSVLDRRPAPEEIRARAREEYSMARVVRETTAVYHDLAGRHLESPR